MSTDTTPESSTDGIPASAHNESCEYQCPFCDTTYNNEILARVHVTRSEDGDHLNYDGFMPETEIEIIDHDGEIVETVSRRPKDIDATALTVGDLPDEKPEEHKHILLVAAYNAHETTYTTIEEKVNRRLDNHDLDSPSYSTIRRVIRSFYRPQEEKQKTENVTENEGEVRLDELTPKQQAIVITRLSYPEESTSTIADKVGCAPSYPSQVFEKTNSLTKRLETRIGDEESLEEVIYDELGKDSIDELVERNLLKNIDINPQKMVRDDRIDRSDMWGSPIEDRRVMSASPPDVDDKNDENNKETFHLGSKKSGEDTDSKVPLQGGSTSDEEKSNHPIPRSEVEELKKKAAFIRHTFDRAAASENDDISAVTALAHQFEETCEEILQNT